MKTINLKLFSVTILVASIFATLPPLPVMASGFTSSTVNIVDNKAKDMLSTPAAAAQIEQAIKVLKKYAQDRYLNGDGETIEISTNAPAGLDLSTITIGNPLIVVPNLLAECGALMVLVEVTVVIIILGVAIYITYKVYKALSCYASNINWNSTNTWENPSSISTIKSFAETSEPYQLVSGTGISTIPSNPLSSLALNILSTTNLLNVNTNPTFSIIINGDNSISLPKVSDEWIVGSCATNYSILTNLPSAPISLEFPKGASSVPVISYYIYITNTHPKASEFFLQMVPQ